MNWLKLSDQPKPIWTGLNQSKTWSRWKHPKPNKLIESYTKPASNGPKSSWTGLNWPEITLNRFKLVLSLDAITQGHSQASTQPLRPHDLGHRGFHVLRVSGLAGPLYWWRSSWTHPVYSPTDWFNPSQIRSKLKL